MNHGNVDVPRLRQVLAGLPMPWAADGRLVLAVDVSSWLRPDTPTSADRPFCQVSRSWLIPSLTCDARSSDSADSNRDRWKSALNEFDVLFDGRLTAGRV